MKITDRNVIKNGEKELIDSIIGDLDWRAIETVFKEKHRLGIQDDVAYRQGEIVVHNGNVAYKLDFDVKLMLSILFDRSGDFLAINTSEELEGGSQQTETKRSEEVSQRQGPIKEDVPVELTEIADSEGIDVTPDLSVDPKKKPAENMSQMASEIDQMLSEINES
jgi:hypothetical protein